MRRWIGDRSPTNARGIAVAIVATVGLALACSSAAIAPAPIPAPVTLAETVIPASVDAYRDGGFLVGEGSMPFVGTARFVATEFLDSTAVLVALSIPPRGLSFVRSGDRYAAYYAVKIDLLSSETILRSERLAGEVRVAGFAETTRGDEGVIFQRSMRVHPGAYTIRVSTQDSLGTGVGTASMSVVVPTFADSMITPPIPVFAAEPRKTRNTNLALIPNPRSTARYGADTSLRFYVEAYGPTAPDTILLATQRDTADAPVLRVDTLVLPQGTGVRGAVAAIPIARTDLGRLRTTATRMNGVELSSVVSMVRLGVDLPIRSIGELPDALRYFAPEPEIQALRAASIDARPGVWAAIARRRDPNPATSDNEALTEYARRLRVANTLFRSGSTPGWRTDRGAVVAALAEPDWMSDPQPADSVGSARVMTWEYRRHRLLLVFADATGEGRWRLTPVSEADFRALVAVSGPCVGCR